MKKLLLLPALVFAVNVLMAQDDLPPPTSSPKPEPTQTDQDGNDFKGFKKPKKIDWSKFIIEPNFNLAVSQGRLDVGVSPYVGYNVWKGLYLGGGITYFYTGFSGLQVVDALQRPLGPAKANYHTYGAGVFAQYNVWHGFFGRVKLEVLHRDMSNLDMPPIPKDPNNFSAGFYFPRIQRTIPDLLVGVGYNLLQSRNFFFPIIVSYNLLDKATDKTYSVYPNAWVVQLGFINVF